MTEGEKGSFVTRLVIDYSEIKVKISLLCEHLKAQGEELENFGNRLRNLPDSADVPPIDLNKIRQDIEDLKEAMEEKKALERRLMLVSES